MEASASTLQRLYIVLLLVICVTLVIIDRRQKSCNEAENVDSNDFKPGIRCNSYYKSFAELQGSKSLVSAIVSVDQIMVANTNKTGYDASEFSRNESTNGNMTSSDLIPQEANFTEALDSSFSSGYITLDPEYYDSGVGLGNLMFMYAGLHGLAKTYGLRPALPMEPAFPLFEKFSLSVAQIDYRQENFRPLKFDCCCCYSLMLHKYAENKMQNLSLIGYLQSWKYFREIYGLLRTEFIFLNKTENAAKKRMASLNEEYCSGYFDNDKDCIFIGVHIRRGDVTKASKQEFGYRIANRAYLIRAMNYYIAKHGQRSNIIFAVLGNDRNWMQRHLQSRNFPIGIGSGYGSVSIVVLPLEQTEDASASEDMCLLTLCDHLIITTGTFGWWAGYLLKSGGEVVYFRNHTWPGTALANDTIDDDYFLPKWTPH